MFGTLILHLYVHYTHLIIIGQLLVCCWCVSLTNFTSISPLSSSTFYCAVIGVLLVCCFDQFYINICTVLIYFLLCSYWGCCWCVYLTNFTSISPPFSSTFLCTYWCPVGVVLTNVTSIYPLFSTSFCADIGVLIVTFSYRLYTNLIPKCHREFLCGFTSFVSKLRGVTVT